MKIHNLSVGLLTSREIAVEQGRVRYAGRPCKRGHVGLRHVSTGGCVECKITRERSIRDARH